MKKKKILIMGAILLSFLWGLRVWKVNKSYPDIPQKTYKAGEWVNLSGSQMEENDNRDGYYLRIDEKNILSTDEYLNLYAEVSEKTEYDELVKNQNLWKPDKVYLLTVTLKNESIHESTERGINWSFFYLYEKNRVLDFEPELYRFANRSAEGSPALSLKPGTEKKFYLPYGVYEERMEKDIRDLEKLPFQLIVSLWPGQNLVKVPD
ncbi:MAG: hypothetical protein V8S22_07225 [Lachnospiraceae bacterium]